MISVVVLDNVVEADEIYYMRTEKDYRFEYFKSTGAGGQHRNKTLSGVKCIHIPTGIKQERTTKCQHSNKRMALEAVNNELDAMIRQCKFNMINSQRSSAMGSGERGSRTRTYKFQEGMIIDHVKGKTADIRIFYKGQLDKLFDK